MALIDQFITAKKFQNQLRLEAIKDPTANENMLIFNAANALGVALDSAMNCANFIRSQIPTGTDIITGNFDEKVLEERNRLEQKKIEAQESYDSLVAEVNSLDSEIASLQSSGPINASIPNGLTFWWLKNKVKKLDFNNSQEGKKAKKSINKRIARLEKSAGRYAKRQDKIKAVEFSDFLINSLIVVGVLCSVGFGGLVGVALHAVSTFAAVVGPAAGLGIFAIGKAVYDYARDSKTLDKRKSKLKNKEDKAKGKAEKLKDSIKSAEEKVNTRKTAITTKTEEKNNKLSEKPAKESAKNSAKTDFEDFELRRADYKPDSKGYDKISSKLEALKIAATGKAYGDQWVSHAGQIMMGKYINPADATFLRADIPFNDELIDNVYNSILGAITADDDYITSNINAKKNDIESAATSGPSFTP